MELSKNDIRLNVAYNIKYIRKLLGLTQERLAEKVGTSRAVIGSMEEERAASLHLVYKIAQLGGFTIEEMISNEI